jgi:hypothetical protein
MKLATTNRATLCISFILALAAPLAADSNLRIVDAGLHGYFGTPIAIRLLVRNPSLQAQSVHLRVTVAEDTGIMTNVVTDDLTLNAQEQRLVELPVVTQMGQMTVTAEAAAGGSVFARDTFKGDLRRGSLIALICASESNVCKDAQSQIQFSGNVMERADKNRQLAFEVVDDAPDHWWAYSAATAVVLAMPVARLTSTQREAIEGYLRCGGRLILLENEVGDPVFLSAYRESPASPNGERVGEGTLFRVSGLSSNTLSNIFVGGNLSILLAQANSWSMENSAGWLGQRFAARFSFPQLRWILVWLGAYIIAVGIANFAVLRRLRLLEFGWISVCLLAVLFAAGLYFSSASNRPKRFRLDNVAAYYLDSQSPVAAANYELRISAPKRQEVLVSVADAAVFTFSNFNFSADEPNSQIWAEMNRPIAEARPENSISLGPPRQLELSLLKWSFRDLSLRGLREFPGTVHFVGHNRLRNDTGQTFDESVYRDYTANALYVLPALPPGGEIDLDSLTSKPIRPVEQPPKPWIPPKTDLATARLQDLATTSFFPFGGAGRVFAGLSSGPALPVELSVAHEQNAHSLIVVALEQP